MLQSKGQNPVPKCPSHVRWHPPELHCGASPCEVVGYCWVLGLGSRVEGVTASWARKHLAWEGLGF